MAVDGPVNQKARAVGTNEKGFETESSKPLWLGHRASTRKKVQYSAYPLPIKKSRVTCRQDRRPSMGSPKANPRSLDPPAPTGWGHINRSCTMYQSSSESTSGLRR